ncbi:DUF1310 family protein [Streptococcus sanguinis]|uniref:DUF1310 family protein n=1 Tax=Streptococcus sanguinis TaxID=1305 RepID=A0A859ENG3_STRSA|nr:DUF1310 family protein [Streptococcus sanguinis]MBZ2023522.1 DUF1310 domain-containing protein [Streptococcus sanguinis]MBZ2048353.1 DUF1310 domain-containing protein [Streptococcus sanguinis]MBZ2050814.1 DUF1310 domain-containing protein [Streptococcus sanguinis]MBZ2059789.1 DUF1310 domain-containing protein [Streptococcus sanguinis]MCC3173201.1 hypothetical protein [Streptococcus sanguinis]
MKKIVIIFLSIITLSSAMFLGGCSMLNSRSEKEEILQISESKKMKKALENFLKGLDPKALTPEGKIKSYEIQKDKLDYNPMGGLNVYIIINGNEVLNIDMTVQEEDTGEYEVVSYGIPQELSELLGEN